MGNMMYLREGLTTAGAEGSASGVSEADELSMLESRSTMVNTEKSTERYLPPALRWGAVQDRSERTLGGRAVLEQNEVGCGGRQKEKKEDGGVELCDDRTRRALRLPKAVWRP